MSPLRFRRSITIFPGVRINLSKSGMSLSVGPRGASLTLGRRGTFANVGLPGTGLSYRARVDLPGPAPIRFVPAEQQQPAALTGTYEDMLRGILQSRERGAVDWTERVLWLAASPPEDEDNYEEFTRRYALGRFARRMLDGDRAAWMEVVAEELRNEALPFDTSFVWSINEANNGIRIQVQLPPYSTVSNLHLPAMKERALYEDVCCALLVRFAYEIFRTIPEASEVHAIGDRPVTNPATGQPAREILLRLLTDRESFAELNLDAVDPSEAFLHVGGVSKLSRGTLVPLGIE